MEIIWGFLFFVLTNNFRDFKEAIGIHIDLIGSDNLILSWIGYMFYCTKCSSFQISLIISILSGMTLWNGFTMASTIAISALIFEELYFRIIKIKNDNEIEKIKKDLKK